MPQGHFVKKCNTNSGKNHASIQYRLTLSYAYIACSFTVWAFKALTHATNNIMHLME